MSQRICVQPEHLSWPQHGQPQRPIGNEAARQPARVGEGGQKQRIGPDQKARADAGHRSGGGRLAPQEAAEQRRGELRHRREGQKPRLRQRLRRPGHAVIAVGQGEDDGDGRPADEDQHPPHVLVGHAARRPARQDEGHDDVVARHDRQRHGLDDDHGGGRREPADEGEKRDARMTGGHRQRQHVGVGVHRIAQHQQPGHGDGHDEQIDGHEIEREGPGRLAHVLLVGVLHHRHVKLPGQQDEGEK